MKVMFVREGSRQLTGRADFDGAYLGGEIQGGEAGRGSPNRVPFVAAMQTTEPGQAVLSGGGAASAKHPAFRAVNTALGNTKTGHVHS